MRHAVVALLSGRICIGYNPSTRVVPAEYKSRAPKARGICMRYGTTRVPGSYPTYPMAPARGPHLRVQDRVHCASRGFVLAPTGLYWFPRVCIGSRGFVLAYKNPTPLAVIG